jgi:hypothetical protein
MKDLILFYATVTGLLLMAAATMKVLVEFCTRRRCTGRFRFLVGVPKSKGETPMLNISIQNDQKIELTLAPVTASGNPATLDGVPSWTVVSGNATVSPSENGLSAFLVSSDEPGKTVFLVEADADLGEGVETLSESIELTVEGAKAVNLGIVVGTAVPK